MSNTQTEVTLETLAKEAGSYFTNGERIGDTGSLIRILKDGTPEWVRELVQAAHGGMGPDDFRYDWIEDALSAVENEGEDASLEADTYTSDLTRWLHSRADRYAYCDEAVESGLVTPDAGMIAQLQGGQAVEQAEIVSLVLDALNTRLEEVESEQEDEEGAE
jgi:hypothetical protein